MVQSTGFEPVRNYFYLVERDSADMNLLDASIFTQALDLSLLVRPPHYTKQSCLLGDLIIKSSISVEILKRWQKSNLSMLRDRI